MDRQRLGIRVPRQTFNFRMFTDFEQIFFGKKNLRKILNINISGYVNNIIIELKQFT